LGKAAAAAATAAADIKAQANRSNQADRESCERVIAEYRTIL